MQARMVGHADEVAPCSEVPRPAVGFVLVNKVFEVTKRYDRQQLREFRATCVHNAELKKWGCGTPVEQFGFKSPESKILLKPTASLGFRCFHGGFFGQ